MKYRSLSEFNRCEGGMDFDTQESGCYHSEGRGWDNVSALEFSQAQVNIPSAKWIKVPAINSPRKITAKMAEVQSILI